MQGVRTCCSCCCWGCSCRRGSEEEELVPLLPPVGCVAPDWRLTANETPSPRDSTSPIGCGALSWRSTANETPSLLWPCLPPPDPRLIAPSPRPPIGCVAPGWQSTSNETLSSQDSTPPIGCVAPGWRSTSNEMLSLLWPSLPPRGPLPIASSVSPGSPASGCLSNSAVDPWEERATGGTSGRGGCRPSPNLTEGGRV
jgi:hypothetical protein